MYTHLGPYMYSYYLCTLKMANKAEEGHTGMIL